MQLAVPDPGRPVSRQSARGCSCPQAPVSGRWRVHEWGGGQRAWQLRPENGDWGADVQEASTHLHTPRSGRARSAGAPAHRAADSYCSFGRRAAGLARRRGGGEVGSLQAQKDSSPGSCGLVGAELVGLPVGAAGWPAARLPPALACSLPPSCGQRRRAGPSSSGGCGELFPRGRLLGRGSNCPRSRLPTRMLPAHSWGCIL